MCLAPCAATRFTWTMWPPMLNSFRKCSWCCGSSATQQSQAMVAVRVEFAVGVLRVAPAAPPLKGKAAIIFVVAATVALEAAATESVYAQKLNKPVPGQEDALLIKQMAWLRWDCSRLLGRRIRHHCNNNVGWAMMTPVLEIQS